MNINKGIRLLLAIIGVITLFLLSQETFLVFAAPGVIDGIVFNDANADGANNSEPGVANVLVTAYDASGTGVSTDTTIASGAYTLSGLTDSDPYRVEFTNLPAGFISGPNGVDSSSSVVFATSPQTVNFGVHVAQDCSVPAGALLHTYAAAASCGVILSVTPADRYTFGLMDTDSAVPASGRVDQTASTAMFHHPTWHITQLGNTFGVAIDTTSGDIFTAASVNYSRGMYGGTAVLQYGSIGGGGTGGGADNVTAGGTVYIMDAITGAATVFAQLPQQSATFIHGDCENGSDNLTRTNTGVGLGNLTYDVAHDQMFVVNWEDGRIYRLNMSGTVLDTYDPAASDDGSAGFTNGNVPFAVAVSNDGTQLFYGTMNREIFSIDLTASGGFNGTSSASGLGYDHYENDTETLHMTLPAKNNSTFGGDNIRQWASDLQFLPNGNLLAGLRSGCDDEAEFASSYNHNGTTYLVQPDGSGTYNSASQLNVTWDSNDESGLIEGSDDYGGVAYYQDANGDVDYIISAADILEEAGPHGLAVFPDNASGALLDPLGAIAYYDDASTAGVDPKGTGGDVEALSVCIPDALEIGNYVWNDANGNGIQDAGEAPLATVTVTLHDMDNSGVLVGTAITGANGNYIFGGLANTNMSSGSLLTNNNYEVRISLSDPNLGNLGLTNANQGTDLHDSDATPSSGNAVIALATGLGGNNNHSYDFGFAPPVSIGSFVWLDTDGDGIQDVAESGIAGATVALLVDDGTGTFIAATDANGTAVSNQITLANGQYQFSNLPLGDYRVRVTPPAGHVPSVTQTAMANNNSEDDSNIASVPVAGTYESGTFTLSSGGEPVESGVYDGDDQDNSNETDGNMTVDFGFIQPMSIGSLIWFDADGDGTQDGAESGIAGATVALLVDNGGGTFIAATDVGGVAVPNQLTLANGEYQFSNLPPGDYRVRVTPPAGYAPSAIQTTAANNNSEDDSNIASEPVADTYESGTFTLTINGEPTETGTFYGDDQDDANDTDGNMTVDFGFIQPVTIGSFVWLDADGDGVQDGSESGLAGATVTLFVDNGSGTFIAATDIDGAAVSSQATLANGQYFFDNLPLGNYRVRVTPPAGHEPSVTQTTANNDDSEDDSNIASEPIAGTYESGTFGLNNGTEPTESGTYDGDDQDDANETNGNMSVDFGFYEPASLGDLVWEDTNADGVQNVGENGIPSVVVVLYDVTSTPVMTTTTDPSGIYTFTNLIPGDYSVNFTTPAGYVPSPQDQGGDDTADSDADTSTGQTAVTTLISGENDPTWDAGFYQLASIGDYVWLDANADGIQDSFETGIDGITVTLHLSGTGAISTTTTAGGGAYSFVGLTPDDYFVEFTLPAGYYPSPQDQGGDDTADSDADTSTGQTAVTTLTSGEDDPTWDAGVYQLASIGDLVWLDSNGNGIQNGGETGIDGITVTLHLSGTGAISTTTTAGGGAYSFVGLTPDDYFVEFTLPAGYQISPQDQGGDDTADSDANPTTGETIPTNLVSGENDPTWDAGLYQLASLGDLVWEDADADGVQDVGENGIPNVTVVLYDVTSTPVMTTTTDPSGIYIFTNLIPGDYSVNFTTPAGYIPSPQDQGGNDTADSDADTSTGQTAVTTLVSGENDPTWDAGFYQLASIGDYVWLDANADGIQNGSETGIDGITVTLHLNGTGLISTTTTSSGGAYSFIGLTPDDYFVEFTLLAGTYPSPQDQGGDDTADSDADTTTGQTAVTTLTSGEDDPTWDAGVYQLASIGDLVWLDSNGNGIQDGGETGIDGITVTLHLNGTGAISTTTTSSGGAYNFSGLTPDDYFVEFTLPAGYQISPQDQGGNDTVDSDVNPTTGQTAVTTLTSGEDDPTWDAGIYLPASIGDYVWDDDNADGIQNGFESGIGGITVTLYLSGTGPISTTTTLADGSYDFTNLPPGDYYVGFTPPVGYAISPAVQGGDPTADSDMLPTYLTPVTMLVSGENDPTWDAGFYQVAGLGNFVWEDWNRNGVQDGGEPGIVGVPVTLTLSGGGVITTTVTDGTGLYQFLNLPPADYVVTFGTPAGYYPTLQDAAGDDAADSDADPITGETAVITLPAGTYDPTWDAGFFQPVSIGSFVWLDADGDGTQSLTESGIVSATVELLVDNGSGTFVTATDVNGTAVASQLTLANGEYFFNNLPPGNYRVRVTPPAGHVPSTTQTAADNDNSEADSNIASEPVAGTYESGTFALSNSGEPTETGSYDGDDQDDANETDGNMTVDFGFIQPMSIGSFIWLDEDIGGTQDLTEPGIAGATVQLLVDDGTGTFIAATDVNGVAVANQTTLADGQYQFGNLPPGDYRVRVTPPASYEPTTTQMTGNNNDTEDDSNIASEPVAGTYESGTFTLIVNGEPTESGTYDGDAQDDANETDGNMTVDFGFYQPASLGNYVWLDSNEDGIQNGSESGILGVTVVLYDVSNTPIMTTTTNASGIYTFTNLIPGDYSVGFTPLVGYQLSPQDQGGDTTDSDADRTTGRTILTTLVTGENDPTWDAGLFIINPDITIVKGVSVASTVPNQTAVLTYTLSVTNTGNVVLNSVNVTDTLPVGLTFVPASATPVETGIVGQTLNWDDLTGGLDFNPGDNLQIVFEATLTNTIGTYINEAGVIATIPPGNNYPGDTVEDIDDIPVIVADPSVALDKEMVAPGIVDGVITYTIRITNTGPSTLDILPLFDTFTGPMEYIGGTPAADTVDNVGGSLVWNDLTTTFGDLAPGQVITIVTTFQITSIDTEVTIVNSARVQGGIDLFSNPTNEPSDTVTLVNIPTAVELTSFTTSSIGEKQVRVDWTTASEIDNFGFRVYRSQTNEFSGATEVYFEPSAVSGGTGTGASYQYVDAVPSYGTWYYWLEDVETGGETAVHGSVSVVVSQLYQIFIPIIMNP